jgi:Zn-dependent protease
MRGSWRIGEAAGIGIFIHWSFLILPILVGSSAFSAGGLAAATSAVLFVLAIFGCVVLHELGHALAARRYGIPTRDITLLPIGGIARLERMPTKPVQELVIALAGPAVNVVIAGVLFLALTLMGNVEQLYSVTFLAGPFLARLMIANVILVVFNLLPAFPMDGGRVLRSILAMFTRYDKATDIAAGIGQVMALLFVVVGVLTSTWTLLFVALFVFLAARGEAAMARQRVAFDGMKVGDVMQRHFYTVESHAPLSEAAQTVLFTPQEDFPVVSESQFVGMLSRNEVLRQMAAGRGHFRVSDFMRRDVPTFEQSTPLESSLARMQAEHIPTAPVARAGVLVGLLSARSIPAAV